MGYSVARLGRLAVLILAGCAFAQAQGSIEGRVLNAASGEAVRKVTVTLTPAGAKGKPATAVTDENGRFSFRALDAGGYRLSGERSGYRKQAYGARLNPSIGSVLVLAAGEARKDITFKLAPDAVISGRVLDQQNETMPNLLVAAFQNSYERGKRQWTQAGAAQTNDRGEYRIAGLAAGRYLVSATNLNIGIGLAAVSKDGPPAGPETAYATTYYGNTMQQADAAPVDVRAGEVRSGTDIQMVKTATVRIRGKVSGAPGGKIMMVMLLRKGAGARSPGSVGLVQQADGTFEIQGVTPGSYLLTARSVTEMTASLGAMPLEVGEEHLPAIEFRLAAPGELSGRLAGAKSANVTLESLDFPLLDESKADVGEDGKFTLHGPFAGKYRLRVSGLVENAYVKSVRLGGQEVDEDAIEPGGAAGPLQIAVSASGAEVEGVVRGADDKPMAGATVVLIPESRRESRYANASTEADGAFKLHGVAAGKYKLLAWEDLEPGAYQDADFVKKFQAQAVNVTAEENGRVKVTLKGIAYENVR